VTFIDGEGGAARVNAHRALDRKCSNRAAEGPSGKLYHTAAENNEAMATQIAAQNPSDRNSVTIKAVPVSGRS
jgi:hypothetical protein